MTFSQRKYQALFGYHHHHQHRCERRLVSCWCGCLRPGRVIFGPFAIYYSIPAQWFCVHYQQAVCTRCGFFIIIVGCWIEHIFLEGTHFCRTNWWLMGLERHCDRLEKADVQKKREREKYGNHEIIYMVEWWIESEKYVLLMRWSWAPVITASIYNSISAISDKTIHRCFLFCFVKSLFGTCLSSDNIFNWNCLHLFSTQTRNSLCVVRRVWTKFSNHICI